MAGRTEARIAALLSLLAATLLLAHALLLHPPRASAAAFTVDRFLSALRFDARQLVALVTRRNMILLCHAILLLILRDAGLLAAPARRRSGADTAADASSVSDAQPTKPKSDCNSAAGGGEDAHLNHQRRQYPAQAKASRAMAQVARTGPGQRGYAAVQEIHLAEKLNPLCCFAGVDHVVGAGEIAAARDKIACLRSEPAADDERSRGGEELARQFTEEADHCADDVDEMNRKFEDFIATMRRKMQLESRQLLVKV